MSQTLAQIYLHIVFSTKRRIPWITEQRESELLQFLITTCKALGCYPLKIGGNDNHIHLLIILSKNISLAHFLLKLKTQSSRWFKESFRDCPEFAWQKGYAAFSVESSRIDQVTKNISNQRVHHQVINFQDELKVMLKTEQIDFDERFLWD